MAEFSSSTYSEVDANNNAAPPDGAPAGTFPNQSEGIWRATLGAVKRFWDRSNGTITTTGSAGSYVYTPANTAFPTAYVSGERYAFKANFTSVGNDTLNINTLGARPIVKAGATGLLAISAGDIQINQIVETQYNSTFGGSGAMQMVSPIANSSAANVVTGGTPSITNHVPKYSDTTGLAVVDGYAVGTAVNSLVQLDGTANLTLGSGKGVRLIASGTGSATLLQAASAALALSLIFPATAGLTGNSLQTDGSGNLSWGGGGISKVALQAFTSTGTYTPTSGMLYCIVFCTGGGAAGGAGAGVATGGAGGGGAGGTAIKAFTAATIGASQTVTINGAGGTTTFGALLTGSAGSAGGTTATNAGAAGGAGGGASSGTLNVTGGGGDPGGIGDSTDNVSGSGGSGGASFWGGGGSGGPSGLAGSTGAAFGSGGGGGGANSGGAGAGKAGVVFVIEFTS